MLISRRSSGRDFTLVSVSTSPSLTDTDPSILPREVEVSLCNRFWFLFSSILHKLLSPFSSKVFSLTIND